MPHKDQIKKKLKMSTSDSVAKIHRTFTVSYSARKRRLINPSARPAAAHFTETVVGLDDEQHVDHTQEHSSNEVLIETT